MLGALKLARGFERQKLGRRHKDAQAKSGQDDGRDVERINDEIAALKALDLNNAAEFYIARTLCRIKTVSNGSIMPEKIKKQGQGRSPYQSNADVNITARLFKSTAVKNTMDAIEKQIRTLVNVSKQDSEEHVIVTLKQTKLSIDELDGRRLDKIGSPHDSLSAMEESNLIGNENVDEMIEMDDSETVSDYMNIDDGYAEKIASATDSDLGSDSVSDSKVADDFSKVAALHSRDSTPTSHSRSLSPNPSHQNQRFAQPPQLKPLPVKKTTFLPTLASGYISGSDSDSYTSDQGDRAAKPKRRNRMGQQARRALAEHQYGSAAKHLKDGKATRIQGKAARDVGWDLKRGASDVRGKSHGGRGGFAPGVASRALNREQRKPAPRTKDDTGSLHPSWTAKKKLKEQQNLGMGAYQGKKVVFE